MKTSLISGKTQPVEELSITGHIVDGICRAAFKATFKNKQDIPVETSFTFPLPAGVCSTSFKVNFQGQKLRSRVMRDDSARLDFDDTVAQSDFAAMAQVGENNEIKLALGAMSPGETCKVSIYFDVALTPTTKGWLLVLPLSVTGFSENLSLGMAPPPLKVSFDVKDSRPIKEIKTPFCDNTVIDNEKHTVVSPSVSLSVPFHLSVVLEKPLMAQCLVQTEADRSFLRVVTTTPRAVRDHPSQFTVLLGHSADLIGGPMSMVYRAIEYFVLSLPQGCQYNFANFGYASAQLFEEPKELDMENREKALSILKQPDEKSVSKSFEDVQKSALEKVKTDEMESIVVVIAASLPADTVLLENHDYFLLDPLGGSAVKIVADKTGATYIPVSVDGDLVNSLLSVIKLTASYPLTDVAIKVDEGTYPLPAVRPGMFISAFVSVPSSKVGNVSMVCPDMSVDIPVEKSPMNVIHHLWAFEKLQHATPEEAAELALAAQILTPETACIVAVERDEDLSGEVGHIETQISKIGVGWISTRKQQLPEEERPHPHPNPGPIYQFPPMPVPMPRPMPRPVPYFAGNTVLATGNDTAGQPVPQPAGANAGTSSAKGPGGAEPTKGDQQTNTKRLFFGTMSASKDPVRTIDLRVPISERPPIQFKGGRKPFFLLRLLQLQNADGSWTVERNIAVCCGFPIPEDSMGLDRKFFLTAFVLVCLRLKAKADEDKWELVAEKALTYLMCEDPGEDWDAKMAAIEATLTQ